MATKKKALQAAAGAAGAGEAVYVDSLFSTYLYTGNGSTQTITNGIDLAGEGGLVWLKNRSSADSHKLYDTERGAGYWLASDATAASTADADELESFNSDGFSLGVDTHVSQSGQDYATWTFRKAPGFFDVVTYTGNGSTQTISHNLGCVPGFIAVKRLDSTSNWTCYHKSLPDAGYDILLNSTDAARGPSYPAWNGTDPTDSVFSVGNVSYVNASGGTYVAYLFADGDDAAAQIFGTNGDQAVVKCGSYTGNGSTRSVDFGFEPQWVMIKSSSLTGTNWTIFDSMRGIVTNPGASADAALVANTSNAEIATDALSVTATGFIAETNTTHYNRGGQIYIYIAIRRPHKPAESGTEVFAIDTAGGTSPTPPTYNSGFPVDFFFNKGTSGTDGYAGSRLQGANYLTLNSTASATSSATYEYDFMDGARSYNWTNSSWYAWMFKRSPGFFDVVCYTGDGNNNRQISHNLGVAPEIMIIKRRNSTSSWTTYIGPLSSSGDVKYMLLQATNAALSDVTTDYSSLFYDTLPTNDVFTVGNASDVNNASGAYIAYLFASQDGISKVFSVTKSSGSNTDVNCGFSSGARFVILKRTDSTGDWYVWDTERGIVSGNDPYLLLNSTAAENTSTDYIDPLSTGFTIVDGGLADGDYIGLAVS